MQNEDPKGRRRPRIVGIEGKRPHLMSDPEDNAKGCRERAEADLRRAAEGLPVNARRVLEKSARSWLAKAEPLERLEKSFAKPCPEGPQDD
ncbi:MAG TPA: hypothetical protein VFZ88_01835 [Sphingomicrobium sp.]|jgi:hypothetical protein